MLKFRRWGTLPALLPLLLALAPTMTRAQEAVTAEDRLPGDVYLYLTIPDVPEAKNRISKSSLGQLLRDEDLAEIRERVIQAMEDSLREAERELGMSIDDLKGLFAGEVSVAVVQPPGQEVAGVAFIDYGESRSTLDEVLQKMDDALQDEGAERTSDDYNDIEIVQYTIYKDNGDPAPMSVNYFIDASYIVFGSNPNVLEQVIDRWDGGAADTFASSEGFGAVMEQVDLEGDRPAAFTFFVNPVGLFRAAIMANEQMQMQGGMALSMLPILGLDRLQSIAIAADFNTERFDSVSKSFIHLTRPTSGLLKVFQLIPADPTPPDWVRADAVAYSAVHWDLAAAYNAIETMFDFYRGPGSFAGLMDQIANAPDGPNIHPKEDVVDHLTGTIRTAAYLGSERANLTATQVFAFELSDSSSSDSLREVIQKLVSQAGSEVREREFQGVTIYEFDIPAVEGETQVAGFGIDRGHLFFATNVQLLENVIRGNTGDKLANARELDRVMEHVPGEVGGFSFSDQKSQMENVYNMFTSEQFSVFLEGFLEGAKLPPFEDIDEHFGLAGSYSVSNEEGALIHSFYLRPETE